MCLLLGEDRQVLCDEAEDGEPERNEHGRDHHFGPLRRVTRTYRVLHSGDGDIQTVGYEAQQASARPPDTGPAHSRRIFGTNSRAERSQHREEDLQQEEVLLVARHED